MGYISCRLDYDDLEFWKKKYDKETKESYYEKVKESGSLYFRKADHDYFSNNMVCNCINDASKQRENMRLREYENCDYYVIEPSGIKIPKNKLIPFIDRDEIIKDNNSNFQDISVNTFICNCISDRTKDGRERIPASEVEKYKKDISNVIVDDFSTRLFNAFDLMAMFSIICYEHTIPSFNKSKLLKYIIDHKYESKYSKLLKNIKIHYHEHYDESEDLDKAIDTLEYLGMIHPDYSKENIYDYNPYSDLAIDRNVIYWVKAGIGDSLKAQYPEILEFVNEYNSVNNYIIPGVNNTSRIRRK